MKIRKELWFGFTLMALLIVGALYIFLSAETITRGHLGLLMLSLVVVAIMMGFPTAFTLMGMGIVFTWLSYDGDVQEDPRPVRAVDVQGDEQRRADLDPAVRLHGIPGRARQPDREAVQVAAPGHGPHSGLAGRCNARDLRGVRNRHRHRRRRRHPDGPAGVPGDAEGGLQHQAGRRCHYRGRLPRHPDPAVGHADRVRGDGGRIGRAAVCRCVLPGHHAGRPVHRLRDHRRQDLAAHGAPAVGRGPHGQAAAGAGSTLGGWQPARAAGGARRLQGAEQPPRRHRRPHQAGHHRAAPVAVLRLRDG